MDNNFNTPRKLEIMETLKSTPSNFNVSSGKLLFAIDAYMYLFIFMCNRQCEPRCYNDNEFC